MVRVVRHCSFLLLLVSLFVAWQAGLAATDPDWCEPNELPPTECQWTFSSTQCGSVEDDCDEICSVNRTGNLGVRVS